MDSTPASDLRSDTVSRPTAAMRAAIAAATVGDDQYGEDTLTTQRQERCAALLGKEAALWLPSGTMAKPVALRVLARPGDEVITSREAHAGWHETGGAAANAGVQLVEVGGRAGSTPVTTSRPRSSHAACPCSRPPRWCRSSTRTTAAAAWCPRRPRPNASAPRPVRVASPASARGCGTPLSSAAAARPSSPVVFHLADGAPDAAGLVATARARGVLLNAFATRTVRAVTHLDVNAAQVARAAEILTGLLS